jgi:hypothetical protein
MARGYQPVCLFRIDSGKSDAGGIETLGGILSAVRTFLNQERTRLISAFRIEHRFAVAVMHSDYGIIPDNKVLPVILFYKFLLMVEIPFE